jgi:hypothetical protein
MKRVYRALDPGMYSGLNIVVARSPQMGLGHVPAQTQYPRPLGQIERYFLNCHYLNIIDKVDHVSGQDNRIRKWRTSSHKVVAHLDFGPSYTHF